MCIRDSINTIFKNLIAQPTNFEADSPGDVIQYIAAHDNLTLFDIIAQSIKKDPSKAENYAEIHRRLRLGNLMVLTEMCIRDSSESGLCWSMNCDNCDEPKNSFTAAVTGRILMICCGVKKMCIRDRIHSFHRKQLLKLI